MFDPRDPVAIVSVLNVLSVITLDEPVFRNRPSLGAPTLMPFGISPPVVTESVKKAPPETSPTKLFVMPEIGSTDPVMKVPPDTSSTLLLPEPYPAVITFSLALDIMLILLLLLPVALVPSVVTVVTVLGAGKKNVLPVSAAENVLVPASFVACMVVVPSRNESVAVAIKSIPAFVVPLAVLLLILKMNSSVCVFLLVVGVPVVLIVFVSKFVSVRG